ncbi:uncharacterized protein BJX67DRAFT_96477 [Aspergillus lucknowensis]|uniref:Cx9C motif-containing protein 4, mitochondrial n=1 Tax=Aspergillus lucknowensis TaxID=176173 RepID=A0ABR4M5Z1_9EURO
MSDYIMGGPNEDIAYDPPCHPRAVSLSGSSQRGFSVLISCLTRNSYQEEKCQTQINALYECCNSFYKEQGEDARTPSCPKPNLLRLRMKQRGQAS